VKSRLCHKARKQGNEAAAPFIHSLSKGVCTLCEAAVWLLVEEDRHIKFCQQCKNFGLLADFMEKRKKKCLLGSCARCRGRISKFYKAKPEVGKRRLEENSAGESNNITVSIEVDGAFMVGMRRNVEVPNISGEASSKQLKIVAHVGVEKGAGMMSFAAGEADNSS